MKKCKIDYTLFDQLCKGITDTDEYLSMKKYTSHANVSCYQHSINVAKDCYRFGEKHRVKCDMRSLIRGALLHDYYLYDWHDKNKGFRWHGFKHSRFALNNAMKVYDLNNIEQNIIISHMFPLNITKIPIYKESIIVTLMDKKNALSETFSRFAFR